MKIKSLLVFLLVLSIFSLIGCGSTPKQENGIEETGLTEFDFVLDVTSEMDNSAVVYVDFYSLKGIKPMGKQLLFELNGKSNNIKKYDTTALFAKGKAKSARFVTFSILADGKKYTTDRYSKKTLENSYISVSLSNGKLVRDKTKLICQSEDADFVYEYVNNTNKDIYVGIRAGDESYNLANYPMELLNAGDTLTFNINLDDLREYYEPEEFFINAKYSLNKGEVILCEGHNNLMSGKKLTISFNDKDNKVELEASFEELE